MHFSKNIKSTVKMALIGGLAIMSTAVFAKDDTSIINAMKNQEAVSNTALNPGHSKHDKDGDGRDEHMDGKNGNGYGHGDKDKGGKGGPPECVPEPASMLAMGLGAGIVALKKRRAAKKA